MPARKVSKKRGRPQSVKLALDVLEGLGTLQCTYAEIAAFLGCTPRTIERRLNNPKDTKPREAFERGKAKGLTSLRRTQFALSKKNASMAIFLGKQYLGQRDIQAIEASGPGGGPIQTEGAVRVYIPDNARDTPTTGTSGSLPSKSG